MTANPQDPEAAWVVVPREPDGEMDVAGEAVCDKHIQMTEGRYPVGLHSKVYRAMIAAAPKPPRPPAVAELSENAETALAALRTARCLMEGSGAWTNPAGYTTDAALWIERAQRALELAHAKG